MTEDADLISQLFNTQPTRRGGDKPPRRFDKTQLHERTHGQQVHRDYAAHFFRWGWVARHIQQGDRILDVGCGQDQPLIKILAGNMNLVPQLYLGVDLNEIPFKFKVKWGVVLDKFDFVGRWKELREAESIGHFNQAVAFEILEHMGSEDAQRLLEGIYELLSPGGTLYLSTPVFDGHRAVNHVKEWEIPELKGLIEAVGFKLEHRWGTFANVLEIKKVATPEESAVFDRLKEWFSNDVLSCIFAPYHPDHSRNNLWVCRKS